MRLGEILAILRKTLAAPFKGKIVGVETSYREDVVIGPDGKPQRNSLKVTHEMSEAEARRFLEENQRMLDQALRDPVAYMRSLREKGREPRFRP